MSSDDDPLRTDFQPISIFGKTVVFICSDQDNALRRRFLSGAQDFHFVELDIRVLMKQVCRFKK
ncbi:hypothetical protein D3C85_1479580 [compost metagenome]